MPAPDPDAVWIERSAGRIVVSFSSYCIWKTQDRNRKRRAVSILRRAMAGTWACRWCGEPIPTFRRADAVFCREGCRKASARSRIKGYHHSPVAGTAAHNRAEQKPLRC